MLYKFSGQCRKLLKKVAVFLIGVVIRIYLFVKHWLHYKLAIIISSASWGNVGDHAIVLGEKSILSDAVGKDKIIDFNSVQFSRYKSAIIKSIRPSDLIIIDGGGNFGDTWPETQRNINSIIAYFPQNPIFIFPESWFFSETVEAKQLLKETTEVISKHENITICARDSYSYQMMMEFLPSKNILFTLDSVFMLPMDIPIHTSKGVALVIRDDKESVNKACSKESLSIILSKEGYDTYEIANDCYKRIRKGYREKYVYNIIRQYMAAEVVITDRFHGLVFGILCNKPCIIIDNKTGKVGNFYRDIKLEVDGIMYLDDKSDYLEKIIQFVHSSPKLVVSNSFKEWMAFSRKILIKSVISLMEEK